MFSFTATHFGDSYTSTVDSKYKNKQIKIAIYHATFSVMVK